MLFIRHEFMPGPMLSSYTPPTHPTPNPSHPPLPQPSLSIRRHRNKNPGSVGHKHGPRIGSIFKAQNWDRVSKWCKISGPDSGHKNPSNSARSGQFLAGPHTRSSFRARQFKSPTSFSGAPCIWMFMRWRLGTTTTRTQFNR